MCATCSKIPWQQQLQKSKCTGLLVWTTVAATCRTCRYTNQAADLCPNDRCPACNNYTAKKNGLSNQWLSIAAQGRCLEPRWKRHNVQFYDGCTDVQPRSAKQFSPCAHISMSCSSADATYLTSPFFIDVQGRRHHTFPLQWLMYGCSDRRNCTAYFVDKRFSRSSWWS